MTKEWNDQWCQIQQTVEEERRVKVYCCPEQRSLTLLCSVAFRWDIFKIYEELQEVVH